MLYIAGVIVRGEKLFINNVYINPIIYILDKITLHNVYLNCQLRTS